MIKKIAVVTATRAEYGILSQLISRLEEHPTIQCQLMVTGAHLLEEQGKTINLIKENGHKITSTIEILDGQQLDTNLATAKAAAKALAGFSEAFYSLSPDAVVVLGDRYELLGICSAALLMQIPIVHLHGGELTEGAMDEAIRHAVTKMAHLHFVAAEPYKKRVIQLGEQPGRVFNVGALGVDLIKKLDFLSLNKLETDLEIKIGSLLFVVTYHPATWEEEDVKKSLQNIFLALENFSEATIVWTGANTDAKGLQINKMVQDWIKNTDLNIVFVTSLGSLRYLSLLNYAHLVIGNSSSGIIEAPALKTPTIDIGTRQKGRLKAKSVFSASNNEQDIVAKIQLGLSFSSWKNNSLYGEGNTVDKMVKIITTTNFKQIKTKAFYDL